MCSEKVGVVEEEQVKSIRGDYLTKREAAQLLNVTVRTLCNWMKKRFLPFLKVGRTVRFRRCEIDRYLEENFRVNASRWNGKLPRIASATTDSGAKPSCN